MIKPLLGFTLSTLDQNRLLAQLRPTFFPLHLRIVIPTSINSGTKESLVLNQTPLLPSHLSGPAQPSPFLPGWGEHSLRVMYPSTISCPPENTRSPLSARKLPMGSYSRAWLEAYLPPRPNSYLFGNLLPRRKAGSWGQCNGCSLLYRCCQILLISYISEKKGKEYSDNKDSAAAGWSEKETMLLKVSSSLTLNNCFTLQNFRFV